MTVTGSVFLSLFIWGTLLGLVIFYFMKKRSAPILGVNIENKTFG